MGRRALAARVVGAGVGSGSEQRLEDSLVATIRAVGQQDADACAPDGANEAAALKGQHAAKLGGGARLGRVADEVASK